LMYIHQHTQMVGPQKIIKEKVGVGKLVNKIIWEQQQKNQRHKEAVEVV
jgi:hypothetical protein